MTEAEFEIVFRENFTSLCNLAYTIVKDSDASKDVVQQVFIKFWQMKDELVIHTALKPYLCRAVINTGLNHIKKEKKFTVVNLQTESGIFEEEETESTHNRMELQINKAIEELPPVCQKVFRLSRFSDLTNKEIAEQLDISVKAVEKHITKAFKFLREKLKPLLTAEMIIFLLIEVGFCITAMSIVKQL